MRAAWESMEGGKGRGNGKLYCNTKHYLKVIFKKKEAKRNQWSTYLLIFFILFDVGPQSMEWFYPYSQRKGMSYNFSLSEKTLVDTPEVCLLGCSKSYQLDD